MAMDFKTAAVVCVSMALALVGGCSRDVRLAGKKIRSPKVRTVEHYGVLLDQQASPAEVAFVLLRAIRDDVTAASHEDRQAALDVQFDVCDPGTITRGAAPSSARDQAVYQIVTHWAPALSYYVDGFDLDLQEARANMKVTATAAASAEKAVCSVLLPVDDPAGDPVARVYVQVDLARTADGSGSQPPTSRKVGYWRVIRVGFKLGARPVANSSKSTKKSPIDASGDVERAG